MRNKSEHYSEHVRNQNWKKLSKLITKEALVQDSLLNLSLNPSFGTHPSTYFRGADSIGKKLQQELRFLGLHDIKEEDANNLNVMIDNGQSVHSDEVNRTAFSSVIRLRKHFYPELFTDDNQHVLGNEANYQQSTEYQSTLADLDSFFKNHEKIKNILQFDKLTDSTKKQLEERFTEYCHVKNIVVGNNKDALFQDFIINQGVMAYYRSILDKSTEVYPSAPELVKDEAFPEDINFQSSHLEALHFSWRMIHGADDLAPVSIKNAKSAEEKTQERNELLSNFLFDAAAIQLEYPVRADTLKPNGDTATCSCGQGTYVRTLESMNYKYDEALSHVTRFKDLDNSSINKEMVKAYYSEYLLIALNDPKFKNHHAELLLCYPFSERNDGELKQNNVFEFYSPLHQAFGGRIKKAFFDNYKKHFTGLPQGYQLTDADFAELDVLTNDFCFFSQQLEGALLGVRNNEVEYIAPFHPLLAWLNKPDSLNTIIQNKEAFAYLYTLLSREVLENLDKGESYEAAEAVLTKHTNYQANIKKQDDLLKDEPWFEFYSLLDKSQQNILWTILYGDPRIKKALCEQLSQQADIQSNEQLNNYFTTQLPSLEKAISDFNANTRPFGHKLDLPTHDNINQRYLWKKETRLHRAVLSGNINLLKRVLNTAGCELTLQDEDRNTSLHVAVKKDNLEATEILLEKLVAPQLKALLAIEDEYGDPLLDWAVEKGNLETITTLLKKLDPNQMKELLARKNSYGNTAIHRAQEPEVITALLKTLDPLQIKKLLAIQDKYGLTPLHLAVDQGNLETITALLKKLDSNQIKELLAIKNYAYYTPFSIAVEMGQLDVITALLEKIDASQLSELLEIKNNKGSLLPNWLVYGENLAVINALLNKLNATPIQRLVAMLQNAVDMEQLDVITALLEKLDSNQIKELLTIGDEHDSTLLHWPADWGKSKAIEALLEKLDADAIKELLTIKGSMGHTPLHRAANSAKPEAITVLLSRLNSDQIKELLTIKTQGGSTPLHLAVGNRNPKEIKALLEKLDADQIKELLEMQDNNGWTPVHRAANSNHPECITACFNTLDANQIKELLIIKDDNGSTPLHLAIAKNSPECIAAYFNKLDTHQIKELLAIKDSKGKTPLHLAIAKNNPECIAACFNKLDTHQIKELLAIPDNNDEIPLHEAVANNKSAAITTCFDQLKDAPREEELEQANDGQTSLHKKMKLQ